ncbi:hypothetical protein HGI30_02625 [Paenibacillus albicereus]|uniref:Uncharacterized protein n=1 Tax=Paenibacillus albicereus TaxID=2726185 RepID=A0A6H2GT77_9BACL|nr:hypothetical protein [Paenibacillus albicereus]QJC50595.1 hypothetical protein HGI30_02625 [Paenibacillus albicereus]
MRTGAARWIGLGVMAAGLLLGAAGWYFNQDEPGNVADAAAGQPSAQHVVSTGDEEELLQRLGIRLERPDAEALPPGPQGLSQVGENVARRNAERSYPWLARSADSVSSALRLMTSRDFRSFSPEALAANPQLREAGRLSRTPVYIVTFRGVQAPVGIQGPPGGGPDGSGGSLREANVVVDAFTGVPLLSYSYR